VRGGGKEKRDRDRQSNRKIRSPRKSGDMFREIKTLV